jgi:Transposase DDE domain
MSFCSNVAKNKAVRPSVQRMHQRNAIEGTLSELTRGHGLRRSRYRGFGKVELQNLLIGTACNIKRWLRYLITKTKGTQTRASGLPLSFQSPPRRRFGGLAQAFWSNVLSWQALSLPC